MTESGKSRMSGPLKYFALLLVAIGAVTIPARLSARAVDMTGMVRDAGGSPVGSVTVNLMGEKGIIQSVVTDRRGTYFFVNVAAGNYSVVLEAAGYQTTRYTNVFVRSYQSSVFDFKLQRGASQPVVVVDMKSNYGSISGSIKQQDGSPAVGVDVAAVSASVLPAGMPAHLFAVNLSDAAARTDNNGQFQIEDLPPGKYVLSTGVVTYPNPGCPRNDSCVRPIPSMENTQYLPTGAITVTAGSSFRLEYQQASAASATGGFRVAGRAPDAPPLFPKDHRGPVTKVNITGVVKLYASNCPPSPFTSREERPSPRAVAAIKPDGTFEFRNVPPGKYAVCVAIGEAPYVAGPSVKITDKDIDNLMLPKMRGPGPGATGTPLPSMAGSGTPTLDLARTEKAAQLDRDNAKKTEVAKKR